ncbi:RNA chaperone Hfq [Sphingomicrobium nitratireducens]|uniref:RNA chaperone Hfq n=1 Tax=Sphingomicrobium nitratireducens TaxID=2964666 RepID=UPI00223F6AA8|nr:RNA chaperone Hfq [Sphingomicrobium nitratireducens]
MPSDKPLDIQNIFLNECRKEGTSVTLFLLKGIRLQGRIAGFDPFAVLVKRQGEEQLVYKHAISTIQGRLDGPIPEPSGEGEGLQDSFLSRLDGGAVSLFLTNGVRLHGRMMAHDRYCLLIEEAPGRIQLVYKHAMSTLEGA